LAGFKGLTSKGKAGRGKGEERGDGKREGMGERRRKGRVGKREEEEMFCFLHVSCDQSL